jgi:hypothetical protein
MTVTPKPSCVAAALGLLVGAVALQAADGPDRTVMPIQFPKPPALKERYAKDVKAIPPPQEVKAPPGAPNVLVILVDDLGFGATETFGGPLKTPTLERLAQGMSGMLESTFINVKNKSKTITAEIEVPQDGGHGMILAQAGRFGGWALYAKNGVPAYDYNFLGMKRTTIAGTQPLKPGKHTVVFDFAYDGGGPGKGGQGTLSVDGQKVAEGRIEQTQAGIFSADETADVGIDLGTPVVESIGAEAKSRFTGRILKVTVEVK